MHIGLCIQKECVKHTDSKNNNKINEYMYNYTKPLIYDSIDINYFSAYLLRDIDFSILVEPNENLKIYIIQYKMKDIFLKLNENNTNPNYSLDSLDIIGTYNTSLNNIEELDNTDEYIKSKLYIELDLTFDLNIEFTIFYRKNENDYIMSNPNIKGKKVLLNM